MKNIFEGAKFGDKFLTRDGRIAIYWRKETNEKWHELIVSNDNIGLYVEEDGLAVGNHIITPEWDDDIVSKYTEPIDKEKLDELAKETFKYRRTHPNEYGSISIYDLVESFKAGYRKAKEE